MGVGDTDLTGSRVMVTGGGGFLGRRIVHELEQRDATPIVIRSEDDDLTETERVSAALQESKATTSSLRRRWWVGSGRIGSTPVASSTRMP